MDRWHALVGEPERYRPEVVACAEHRALAREVSDRAVVLLQNDPPAGSREAVLPLDAARYGSVSVIGRLATLENTGDHGSSQAQLPPFRRWARRFPYGPLFGYRWMWAEKRSPTWWFGHGLGYSPFRYAAACRRDDTVTVTLANEGRHDGEEVVQLYVDVALGSDPRPVPTLCGFRRIRVAAGATVDVTIRPESRLLDRAASAGPLRLRVGRSADPEVLAEVA